MMTLYQFNALQVNEQAEVLWVIGVFQGERMTNYIFRKLKFCWSIA
jgi:hypothetical protein